MKRFVAIALAGIMGGALFFTGSAEAWRGDRHSYRRHYRYRHFRPYIYYPFFFGPSWRHRHVYSEPVYVERVYEPVRTTTTYSTYERADNSSQVLGAILGGIGGGVIGSRIGGGRGKIVATLAGSIIGLLAGGEIGKQLDERQRLILASTTNRTLETSRSGTEVPWRDPDSGVHGTVTPKPAYKSAQGRYCREYTQTVVIGGEDKRAYGTACRQPDGSWEVVN
jgi:surface antigen